MAEIVLTTLNAKYIHAAFGLRYLLANLGELHPIACIEEFDINQRPIDIAEVLLKREPKVIGFGVYIWNIKPTTEVVDAIKRVRPDVTVILGGPEVSYEVEDQEIVRLADYVITGEADLKFADVCRQLLSDVRPASKIIAAEPPEFSKLILPYDLYNDDDVAHRIIYVEASRGCPFTCEFCLSSLDIPVRQVLLENLLTHLQRLLDRGVRQFKFVDRTFNLNLNTSRTILQFFLERYRPGHFFHFEMIPDRLPEALREIIARFPSGSLQFEVGIQSFNEEVCSLISRRQDCRKLENNLRFLREQTGVHLHTDLIVGLPGETIESFAAGFDRLIALGPQEIQVGLLKRLRGTPIVRHDIEWQMVYNAHPPYEILQTKLIDFATMQKLRRFARYWDLVGNSGNFLETTPLLWANVAPSTHRSDIRSQSDANASEESVRQSSPFWSFMDWSEWLYARVSRTDSIALGRLTELVFEYLTQVVGHEPKQTAETLWRDYRRGERKDVPPSLRKYVPAETILSSTRVNTLKRQARHLARIS